MSNVHTWLAEPLPTDVRRVVERLSRSDDVVRVALMPDVHLAEEVCVGTVVATTRAIYPNAVGGDIGCGMATIQLNAKRDDIASQRVLTEFERRVPIMSQP